MAPKSKKPKKQKYTPRHTRHFQLRLDHAVDVHVKEILEYKRSKRAEVTAIRDGVRLLWALENNDLSVLFELFPHMKDQFAPGGLNLIEQIQTMLSQQAAGQGDKPQIGFTNATGRPINGPKVAMPVFEDSDEPTVIVRADTKTDSSLNFVNALKSMG